MKIIGRKKQKECYKKLSEIRKTLYALKRDIDIFSVEAYECFSKSIEDIASLVDDVCGVEGSCALLAEVVKEIEECGESISNNNKGD